MGDVIFTSDEQNEEIFFFSDEADYQPVIFEEVEDSREVTTQEVVISPIPQRSGKNDNTDRTHAQK